MVGEEVTKVKFVSLVSAGGIAEVIGMREVSGMGEVSRPLGAGDCCGFFVTCNGATRGCDLREGKAFTQGRPISRVRQSNVLRSPYLMNLLLEKRGSMVSAGAEFFCEE